MATAGEKEPGALWTIGELSHELGVAQHILRYWETRFPQLRPMQRAGNRRYYRPGDVELARKINRLLNHEGYTVRGVQKLLKERSSHEEHSDHAIEAVTPMPRELPAPHQPSGIDVFRLVSLRNKLAAAIDR